MLRSTLLLRLALSSMAALALALPACGGAGTTIPTETSGDAAAPAAQQDSGTPVPVTDDAATPHADASDPDAAADTRIDPIDLGHSWTYDVTIIGTYPLCKSGSHVGQVLGSKVVGGKPSFQVQSFCPGAGTSSYAVTGDRVELYYANTWILSLDSPVAEGHTWTDGANSYSWKKVGPVTVPDGSFEDCWNATPDVGVSYTTFCRGVGPVHWHFVGADGNGYDAVLTAHAF